MGISSFFVRSEVMYYNPMTIDRINSQIADLERMKQQIPQQVPITQNFQLAPQSGLKYANSIDDVQKDLVYYDTPYFSKDFSVLWLKNQKGEIKSYELKEIVEKDEKDLVIESLQLQINQMKEMLEREPSITNVNESNEDEEPTSISNSRTSKKK
jgi:hypothetical protein